MPGVSVEVLTVWVRALKRRPAAATEGHTAKKVMSPAHHGIEGPARLFGPSKKARPYEASAVPFETAIPLPAEPLRSSHGGGHLDTVDVQQSKAYENKLPNTNPKSPIAAKNLVRITLPKKLEGAPLIGSDLDTHLHQSKVFLDEAAKKIQRTTSLRHKKLPSHYST
ncbi:uncharacterized protein PAC_04743 [Phialocephala subalpina]|uniref:Uncharacterized protein n=1 Tax=Phialocephala subalpina TaxID=576137 RepID=A0A1L7WQ16_9HELO|nr:uncharacterized protein PAC_04743 [Phialocephala subalpina]